MIREVFIILGIILMLIGAYSVAYGAMEERTKEIKIVDCFDKFGNKIIGVECEKEPDYNGDIAIGIFIAAIGSGIFLGGLMSERGIY